jgi:poly(A) polymerase
MTIPSDLAAALAAERGEQALRGLDEAGVLTALLPELEAARAFKQPELHFYDVLGHSFAAVGAMDDLLGAGPAAMALREAATWADIDEALDRQVGGVPLRSLLRLAALLHDVAKPATATIVEGRLRFPRHGPEGAIQMRERLPALGFGSVETDFVARMIRYHLRPGELVRNWPPTDHAVRRFATDLDGHVLPLLLVNLSDGWATRGPGYTRENFRRHLNFLNYVLARAWAALETEDPPLASGDELMAELDLGGGRLLGSVITSLREAQQRGEIRDRAGALSFARATYERLQREAADA